MFKIETRRVLIALAALGLAIGGSFATPAFAGAPVADPPAGFVAFDAFLAGVSNAPYASLSAAGRTGVVHTESTFDEMRSYIQDLYRGVAVTHSFVEDGNYFDCVVTATQPTVRDLGITKLATPPALRGPVTAQPKSEAPGLAGTADAYGNATSCAPGTVPMERVSLDRMTRFPSVKAFLAKKPGVVTTPSTVTPAASNPHRYAVGYQGVANHGGNSWVNLWNPAGDFSLSQQWYVAGSGTGTQTVEGGWIHYPGLFGSKSVLFIFFTPDNYATGCYNLTCTGFVQTDNSIGLGVPFSAYSTVGGTQYGFGEQWLFSGGNWWLFYGSTAVGYYPGSVYRTGPLSSGGSTLAEYGGETTTSNAASWPQMGSGQWANTEFGSAAFQNTLFYIPPAGGSAWLNLSPIVTNPACYTYEFYTAAQNVTGAGAQIYFGGPGGSC
jgi:hypothetical protein